MTLWYSKFHSSYPHFHNSKRLIRKVYVHSGWINFFRMEKSLKIARNTTRSFWKKIGKRSEKWPKKFGGGGGLCQNYTVGCTT